MRMKTLLLSLMAALALVPLARAEDVTVTLSKVHLCCDSCVKGANKAASTVDGVSCTADKADGTVIIVGPNDATVQKAVDALVKGGFYGKSSLEAIKVVSETGAKGEMVKSLKVSGVHLCCPKCVKAVKKAVDAVPGVTADTATKGEDTFEVTGDFKDTDVFAALQKAGLTGKCAMQ